MIMIKLKGGKYCPCIDCDACGKDLVGEGAVMWDGSGAADRNIYAACKGSCMDEMERRMTESGGHMLWAELPTFLGDLVGNCGFETPIEPEEFGGLGTLYPQGLPFKRRRVQ